MKTDNKEQEQEDETKEDMNINNNGGAAGDSGGITGFFLDYFAEYVKDVRDKESKGKLYKLLTQYEEFLHGSPKTAVRRLGAKVADNQHLLYDPAFVVSIKHMFEDYSDEEMNKWYLKYWNMHGIKCVIDTIYECGFKFDGFCNLLKQYPKRLQDNTICKFDEWLELVVQPSKYIPDATKLIISQNPPLKLTAIMNMKNEKKRKDCLERLKLVLVEDDGNVAGLLGFGQQLEMPLVKYKKVAICNSLMRYLLQDSIPNLHSQGVYQDKQIVSFFEGKVGERIMRFINQLIQIVERDSNANPVRVELLIIFCCVFVMLCFVLVLFRFFSPHF